MLARSVTLGLASLAAFATAAPTATSTAAALPTVDLGYQLHKAIAYNDTGMYYNFSNIRYAENPSGNNRFRAPKAPLTNRGGVRDGHKPKVCPQVAPAWIDFASSWITQYLEGENITLSESSISALNSSVTLANAPATAGVGVTEDCLFLDVFVPKSIFDNNSSAAVMVWIYGGGYTEGSKASGDPAGLLERSMSGGNEGVIYVAMNYRLGVFGWLGGETIGKDGVANAGLYDQRFALEWVQTNIHLFGGDPTRVTVFGESAGGGSIEHQITAFGGSQSVPFARAIPQSPGFLPQANNTGLENQLNRIFQLTNTTTVKQLRKLPYEMLAAANYVQVFESQFGQFTYGPSVDGVFVPATPAQLLAEGKFAKDVQVMVGHNLDEGLLFSDPLATTNDDFRNSVVPAVAPYASAEIQDYIANTLYPPVFNGTYGYTDNIARQALMLSEVSFTCNVYYLSNAYNHQDYVYYFTIYPGLHGSDVAYTYYNGPSTSVLNATAAIALQDWLTTFAQNGVPTTPDVAGAPIFLPWGANGTSHDLGLKSIENVLDPTNNQRCAWWQQGLYL